MGKGTATGQALSQRASLVLKSLIETHIGDGQPVGSRTLAKLSGLEVSAATIRNIMADLEDAGYLSSPHTSAGRIPTPAGYRLFIDSLLQVRPLNRKTIESCRAELETEATSQGLVQSASRILSGISHMAGIVTLPKQQGVVLDQIEFLKLSGLRVLAVLVMSNGDVQNRILKLERDYSRSELDQAGNYLTQHFSGQGLLQARDLLTEEMKVIKDDMNDLMGSVMDLGGRALKPETQSKEEDFVVAGEMRLMDYHELSDIEKLRKLFDAFNQKGEILHVLDQCLSARSLQIYIGRESGTELLGSCSMITAPYFTDGNIAGVLGVIGPTRMAYDRIIPMVDVTARLLGAALNSR